MKLLSLDLQFFAGEKTEKATPKKRQDSRKKGQVAKSQDVNTAVLMLAIFLFLWLSGEYLLGILLGIFKKTYIDYLLIDISETNIYSFMLVILQDLVFFLGPIFLLAVIAAIGANYAQIGFLFSTEAIQMKLEKINPIQGFKKIFSVRSLVELVKSLLKISFIGGIAFSILWLNIEEILFLSQKSLSDGLLIVANITIQLGVFGSVALLFLAVLDYFYQKYDFEKNIRMSKQDIKDEYKNIEGDPLIKSKIKQRQREMAMRRMMQEVPNADVVITNPTHYAIALKYDENKADAPYIVAKGVDLIAQKIKLIAKENEVITVENRSLARALYSQADIGETVPEEFFKAVAEILAFVYKTKNRI